MENTLKKFIFGAVEEKPGEVDMHAKSFLQIRETGDQVRAVERFKALGWSREKVHDLLHSIDGVTDQNHHLVCERLDRIWNEDRTRLQDFFDNRYGDYAMLSGAPLSGRNGVNTIIPPKMKYSHEASDLAAA